MFKLRLITVVLLISSGSAFTDDTEIICPCTVETVSDSMAVATFTVARQFESQDVVGFYVSLAGNDSPRQFSGSQPIGATEYWGLPSLGNTETVRIEIPFRYTDRENTDLRIAELKADGSIRPYKFRSLATNVKGGTIQDTNAYTSNLAFRYQIEISATTSELIVALPNLVNLGSDITDRLRLQLALNDPSGNSYYLLYEQELAEQLLRGEEVNALSISGPNNLDQYPESHSDLVVFIVSLDENGNPKYLMLEDTLAQRGALDKPLQNNYATQAIDFFSDSDSDGLSDYNENHLGLTTTAAEDIQKWKINVAALTTAEASARYTDVRTKIEHLINHSNNIFELSGVRAELVLSNFEIVGSTNGHPIQAANDSDPNQLDMLVNFETPFEIAQSYHEDNETDVIVAFGKTAADDQACGVAQGWGSADANTYPAASLSTEHKHELFVVGIDCSDYVLAHEFGHVAGLAHSQRQGEMGITSWSRGYGVDNEFVTVMAYSSAFQFAPKIELFSSVTNASCGTDKACGVDKLTPFNGADAVYTLNQTIPHLAALKRGYQPVLSLYGDRQVTLSLNQLYSEPGASAVDLEDGNLTAMINITGNVNSAVAGTYIITYSVTDSDNNATSTQRTVSVSAEADFDGDGISDSADPDDDNDGVLDTVDAFPFDASESVDTDGDGVGNNADTDDDGDGIVDTDDAYPLDPTRSQSAQHGSTDSDGDGFDNQYELEYGSDPNDKNSIPTRTGLPAWIFRLREI